MGGEREGACAKQTGPAAERLVVQLMMTMQCLSAQATPGQGSDAPNRLPGLRWRRGATSQGDPRELRIDVATRPEELQAELDDLFQRMSSQGNSLYGLPALGIHLPGFAFRYRQADGEHYVYVQDLIHGRLAATRFSTGWSNSINSKGCIHE